VTVDLPVLLFTFGIALLAGIIFGVIPAFQGSKVDLTDSLKEGSSSSSSSGGASLLRNFFVVSEVSLAMVLLIGAGLTVRTFQQLQSVDLGFDPEGAVAAEIILAPDRYQNSNQRMRFIETLLERLEQVPGVQSAGIVSTLPLENTQIDVDIYVEGRSDGQLPSVVGIDAASGEYFRALGTRIVDGRTFNAQDREGSLPVVIINETLAKLYWPGERVLGKRLKLAGFGDDDWQVVGVVEDIRRFGLDAESRREVYIPFRQWAEEPGFFVVLRSTGDNPSPLAGTLRALVDEIDPEQPVASTSVMSDLLTDSLSQRRFNTWLIGISAFVALLLAVLGIYGILAYNVAQRTREIGIRLALGENRGSVLALILRRGLMLAGIGVLIGLGASFLLRQLIASLLHGVEASDPLTLAVVSAIFLGVAALASYFPARRATRVDPMVALRYE
jgi:putative ABC transport system permease protein